MSGGRSVCRTLLLLCMLAVTSAAERPIPPLAEVVHRDAEATRGFYPGMLEAAQRRFTQRFHRAGYDGELLVKQDKTRLFLWTRKKRHEQPERFFLHLTQHEIGRTTFLLGHDPGEPDSTLKDPAKSTQPPPSADADTSLPSLPKTVPTIPLKP